MTLRIKGASKEHAKAMRKPGRSPQGKDFFDANRIEKALLNLKRIVEQKDEKQVA
ncbi:hypothetical protein [Alteromonas gracilis]|uniref:hypothetical protein n=1 Tax=Alteromonas gracilis TaxID=1479524 RepID=UPI003735CE9D